uniref:Zinc finger LSD1-type domain-containing protein n=1 Tax=Oryza punctata TaxID=4537 RepID=A0A0E0KGN5_ORYPU
MKTTKQQKSPPPPPPSRFLILLLVAGERRRPVAGARSSRSSASLPGSHHHRCRRGVGDLVLPAAAAAAPGMQSQIVCHGCRSVLRYPSGAPSVCCALCQAITTVPPPAPGTGLAQWFHAFISVELGGRRLLCFDGRRTHSFDFIHHDLNYLGRNGNGSSNMWWLPNIADPPSRPQNVTVVVENPMTVDEKGKLVSNVVVGVTTGK